MAPLASLHAYCGSATLASMLSALGQAVSQNVVDAVSSSWGACEPDVDSATASSYESKFLQGSAQGQAFFFASGDGGSRECTRFSTSDQRISTSFPATAPHATSVAGTRLVMSGASYSSESAWNTCAPCGGEWAATGGGPSALYNRPAWQTQALTTKRATGDVSAVADPNTGVRVRSGGSWWQVGGTSASSPLLAGMWGDVVTAGGRLGNAGERFWALGPDASAALRDVTTGNNGDFAAGPGYDYPTGLGSPKVMALISAITGRVSQPRNVTVAEGDGSLTLSWLPPIFGSVQSYRVYRGTQPGGETFHVALGNVTSFADTGLAINTSYYYQVTAVDAAGEGPRSSEATGRTYGPPRSAPTLTATSVAGLIAIDLAWQPPTLDGGVAITGYKIYRNESASDDPADAARRIGGERFVLQMDADDLDQPTVGKTRDSGPNALHGTMNSVASTSGRFGAGLAFNGTGDRVSVPLSGAFPQATFTAWINPSVYGGQPVSYGTQRIFFMQNPGVANRFHVVLDQNGLVYAQVGAGSILAASTPVPLNQWTHVAVTFGPAGQRMYINGALSGSNAETTGITSTFYTTHIGNSPNDVTTGGWMGSMDEIRFYGVALSAAQIADIAFSPYNRTGAIEQAIATVGAGTLAYRDGAVAASRAYSYRASAINALGEGPLSAYATARTIAYDPYAPANLTATSGLGEVSLSWTPPAAGSPVGYRIYRGTSTPGFLADVGLATSYLDTGLADNATWTYWVAARNATGETSRSNAATATTFSAPRSGPLAFLASPGPGAREVQLSWAPPADDGGLGVSAYRIYRSGSATPIAEIVGRSFVDTGLADNATYTYRVSAVNALGEGPQTSPRSVTTFGVPRSAPRFLAAAPGVGSAALTWAAPLDDGGMPILAYRVFRDASSTPHAEVATTAFQDTALANNATHQYRVLAVNALGEGPRTAPVSVRTFDLPAAPRNLAAATGPGLGQIRLTWEPGYAGGTPIREYRVYAVTAPGQETLLASLNATTFTENDLTEGAERTYRVAAVNDVGMGALTPPVVGRAPTRPPASTNVEAATDATTQDVILTWFNPMVTNPGLYLPVRFDVYRALSGEPERYAASVSNTTLEFVDHLCGVAMDCTYRIVAVGAAGAGPSSARVTITGASASVATLGTPSADPVNPPRLIGRELTVLQMDRDDAFNAGERITRDASLRKDHGRLAGVALAPGRHGDGYVWWGTGQRIELVDATMGALTEGTVMTWIRMDGFEADRGHILTKALPGSWSEFNLEVTPSASVAFRTQDIGSPYLTSAPGSLPLREWAHVAVTWGPEGKRIYIDGELVAQDQDPTGVFPDTTDLVIGADPNDVESTGLLGTLDEFRIYEVALGRGDIQSIMLHPYAAAPVLAVSSVPGTPV